MNIKDQISPKEKFADAFIQNIQRSQCEHLCRVHNLTQSDAFLYATRSELSDEHHVHKFDWLIRLWNLTRYR